jgi:hypothetical protein
LVFGRGIVNAGQSFRIWVEVLSGLGHVTGEEIAADEWKSERSFQTSELVRMRV